jgi:hypothetical protein
MVSKMKGKKKLSPTTPTNNASKGLEVSELEDQNANPSSKNPLGKRKAPSPNMKANKKVKRPIKKSKGYNFSAKEKKLGVVNA